jgi:putative DNA primase/helicase
MILSNELPRFGDASGAISSRFVVLNLRESFYGRENTRLTAELLEELPGILSWALDGLDRITRRGRLSTPAASEDAIAALQDLVSPTSAFVRERCTTGPADEIWVDSLYDAWKTWCEDNGHKPGSVQGFGRDLRAVLPGLRVVRHELPDGSRYRAYKGIALISAHNAKDRGRRGRTRTENTPDSHESGTPDKAPSATSATKRIVDSTSGPDTVARPDPVDVVLDELFDDQLPIPESAETRP